MHKCVLIFEGAMCACAYVCVRMHARVFVHVFGRACACVCARASMEVCVSVLGCMRI